MNITGSPTTLTAVAFQDHLAKSLGLNDVIGPRQIGLGPAARAKQRKPVKSNIDIGRFGRSKPSQPKKKVEPEKEYVLDPAPPPLTLAQRMGLVEAPGQLLSESEWQHAKEKSNQRDDSKMPCVICKEDFGTQEQVLLSCTHVFHRSCLQAFERFTGKKSCPMCRKEQYQTRVIHEGSRQYRHKCATIIQALWRGYVVRCWYLKLRETIPPKDPKLRQKFYQDRLRNITDRMVRSCDFNVGEFLRDIDSNLEASRNVFRDFDARFHQITDDEWDQIQLKAVERGHEDCPICLTALVSTSYIDSSKSFFVTKSKDTASGKLRSQQKKNSEPPKQSASKTRGNKTNASAKNKHDTRSNNYENEAESQTVVRKTVLLSCSHVFHVTCLEMFEELNVDNTSNLCPVCRTKYQKKVLAF